MNWRQVLNTNSRGPSGFITFLIGRGNLI